MKKILIALITLIVSTTYAGASEKIKFEKNDFIIYSTKEGKTVKPKDIIKNMDSVDVLFFGEEHNDSIGHRMQTHLFQLMFKTFGGNATVSMEMFDRDVQHIMDEYLRGIIKKSYFLKDSRKWGNYADYEPMVEFAKENGLNVICANAPFRYVNVASKKGLEGLMKLSDLAKKAIAPLPYNLADGDYAAKLNALMGHDPNDPDSKPAYNMIPGQSLWDASMAYSIYQHLQKQPKSKIIHLNGRFHTDEYYGIVQRLAEYDANIKSLTISLEGNCETYPKIKFEDYKHLGDYIVFTNPAVAKTY